MGWSGSLSASSAVGSAITYTPDTSENRTYSVGSFTAPKKGVYRFQLKGSGGFNRSINGNTYYGGGGGYTDGYLLLEANQTVYIGAGGPLCAAFVSAVTGSKLAAIAKENVYLIAGGGGSGGMMWGDQTKGFDGGAGGGESGGKTSWCGNPGTQTSGYAYGEGGSAGYGNDDINSYQPGWGGDGLYGGYAGSTNTEWGGGGGSGYVKTASLTVSGVTYTSTTTQGAGAASNANGSVVVTYYAAAELPVIFNGTTLQKIFFNGTEVGSLVVDGTKVFMERLRQKINRLAAAYWYSNMPMTASEISMVSK